ncbi:hypothetical protein L6164_019892 [Bauhinia variegata]|uniref:Uncharacterized protein n=1 Tax=Bauhinia variegata TaxID=167791 RepID=A0ACB9MVC3_BAUVA|nr:hypothetical protein L6164_019892 [Bauhinia variegata]
MDHKAWPWKKKSSEKNVIATEKPNVSSKENEEIQALLADKEELEKNLKKLNDELALALSDCNSKDDLVKKQTKIAQEAVAGWEKADTDVLSLKQDLDEALQQQLVYEERVTHLDGALKECMQQLRFVREEQEQRIHDAVMKASKEFEKARLLLEDQLSETNKRLAKAGVENANLSKGIITKENLIEDLKRQLAQAEADHNALMTRLESSEKDNASLNYEVRVLEKELEIRNEEREFNRRTADASHKQHLESVKKIAKLESECQRLRLLVRKRLPGPAALAKMKNEVEMLGRDTSEMRRKKLNSTVSMVEFSLDSPPQSPANRVSILTEQLRAIEEENKTLKESLNRKKNELQFSRTMLARTAYKLSQIESQPKESSNCQLFVEQPKSSLSSHEFSLASMSDAGSDDKISCAESWASALIAELEHFRSGKQKEPLSCRSVGAPDLNLMDDFVEMEKLAVVSVEKAPEISHASLKAANGINDSSGVVGKEIIPVSEHLSDYQEVSSNDTFYGKIPGWLKDVLNVVLEQNRITHRNSDDIVEDIREALRNLNHPDQCELDPSKGSAHIDTSKPPHFSHCISWKHNPLVVDPSTEVTEVDISSIKKSKEQSLSDLDKSLGKIIELIEGINIPAMDYDNSDPLCRGDQDVIADKNLGMPTGYMVRVFQWKTSELKNVLQQFLHVCYDLLNGKADHENFSRELMTALDWIMNHCFSLQDVSSMRDAIKKQFDWDETRSEGEAEIGITSHFADNDKLLLPVEQLPCLPSLATSGGDDLQIKELHHDEREELKNIKDKLVCAESEKEALEGRLQSAAERVESLTNQLQESEKIIASLRLELQTSKESIRMIQNQIQNHNMNHENLDAQLTEADLKEVHRKVVALEVEMENKNIYCEELEAKCLELQLQLESMTKECLEHDINQKDKPLRTEWEITAASEKLAECQETILNLGKQLKALAAPKDASLFDKVIATQSNTMTHSTTDAVNADPSPVPPKYMKVKHRSSLLDQMLAEDDTKPKDVETPKAVDGKSSPTIITGHTEPLEKIIFLNGVKDQDDNASVNSLAIVPTKKQGSVSLWKKLLWRKKRIAKKTPVPFTK